MPRPTNSPTSKPARPRLLSSADPRKLAAAGEARSVSSSACSCVAAHLADPGGPSVLGCRRHGARLCGRPRRGTTETASGLVALGRHRRRRRGGDPVRCVLFIGMLSARRMLTWGVHRITNRGARRPPAGAPGRAPRAGPSAARLRPQGGGERQGRRAAARRVREGVLAGARGPEGQRRRARAGSSRLPAALCGGAGSARRPVSQAFRLVAPFQPAGDQAQAIEKLVAASQAASTRRRCSASPARARRSRWPRSSSALNRPTLVLSHNKTLAAQLYQEFKGFFPRQRGGVLRLLLRLLPARGVRPRLATPTSRRRRRSTRRSTGCGCAATRALFERRDVLIVASVSCIYGLGDPNAYYGMLLLLEPGTDARHGRRAAAARRDAVRAHAARPRAGRVPRARRRARDLPAVRGPRRCASSSGTARSSASAASTRCAARCSRRWTSGSPVYPASHYVVTAQGARRGARRHPHGARRAARPSSTPPNKLLEAQRLAQRTLFDLEMMQEIGYCSGHRELLAPPHAAQAGRAAADAARLLPEGLAAGGRRVARHVPQVRGMYHGDRSRKETLVEFGFRLPSALDNRPLTFEEFEGRLNQVLFVSATPAPYELKLAERRGGRAAHPADRPARPGDRASSPPQGQVDDLLARIRERVAAGERVLVTTLTKRMAEDLTEYLAELAASGCATCTARSRRSSAPRSSPTCGAATFDVLVGINLLREGLDLPEVSLVAILDADKEGYLRSTTSLIQTIGRAARNLNGTVILYADRDDRLDAARRSTRRSRRRAVQEAYNARARHRAAHDHQGHRATRCWRSPTSTTTTRRSCRRGWGRSTSPTRPRSPRRSPSSRSR